MSFKFPRMEKTILPHEFIFVFLWYFIGVALSKKSSQKQGVWKKYKKVPDGHKQWLPIEKGFKLSACYIERLKGDTLEP